MDKPWLTYGIISATGKRVTSKYPPQGHYYSPDRTVTPNSLHGILGTGRCITTGRRKEWRNTELIATNTKKT